MIANPHRINLARIGLWFGEGRNVSEEMLVGKSQVVDLWTGVITSEFTLDGKKVVVETVASPNTDTLAFEVTSDLLLEQGKLGVFFDYPYASGKNKFDAPFVGVWNATANHTTRLSKGTQGATIRHTLDATSYVTEIYWEDEASIRRVSNDSHRYILTASSSENRTSNTLSFTATFAPGTMNRMPPFSEIKDLSALLWSSYWYSGAFISLPITTNSSAYELQRRIVLSQYLLAVNGAGKDPAQESGLVNNGWYGKFHMEMVFWHLAHWQTWNKWAIYERTLGSGANNLYERFLPTSFERAKKQGYDGARIGKMVDPSGRSAPGEINSLLIWQQPHPMYFAEMEYRKYPTNKTLAKWDKILSGVADFMADYAFYNESTGVYDLGPPMYPVSENTNPNATLNPTFELAYWRFGFDVAEKWRVRQGKPVPSQWRDVRDNLAPFPVEDGVYVLYEGVLNMWNTSTLVEDHPGLLGINGWLPPDPLLNHTTFSATVDKVYQTWNFTYSYGWDFPLLAMTAARMGDVEKAVDWLLDPNNAFDEVGMPVGGARVPTPYFPASGGLLLAIGMMAGGWEGQDGPVFPKGWDVEVEQFMKSM
jgi:hypothetical protein